jgi:hypothetical protein
VVQPEKQSKKKTDRRDANALCEILWLNRQRLLDGKPVQGVRVVHLPSVQDAADRQLTELRKRVGQLRTRTINKVKHLLRKHNLEQECPTKGLDTVKGKHWLVTLALGAMDRLEMDLALTQWKQWDEQIETLDAAIRKRQAENAMAALLATIPGCGAYSSLALASRIGDIERFPRPASLANYWGLTPGCRNSGEARRLRKQLLEFVAAQGRQAREGERLLGSSEVLESIIGKFKNVAGERKQHGLTGMALSVGALVGNLAVETVQAAMTEITTQNVWDWCRLHLGPTVQSARQRIRQALQSEQKEKTLRLESG